MFGDSQIYLAVSESSDDVLCVMTYSLHNIYVEKLRSITRAFTFKNIYIVLQYIRNNNTHQGETNESRNSRAT